MRYCVVIHIVFHSYISLVHQNAVLRGNESNDGTGYLKLEIDEFCIISEDGISIPTEYTSYIAPMQSSKLYNEVRTSREKDKAPDVSNNAFTSL